MRIVPTPLLPAAFLLLCLGGCYESTDLGGDGFTPHDGADDRRVDPPPPDIIPPDTPPDYPDVDAPESCRTITPTVIGVEIDMDGCFAEPRPYVEAVINEVSPYCGEAVYWDHEVEWIDDDTVRIIPALFFCSDTWEYCDPGAANTARVRIELPYSSGVFTLVVDDFSRDFACLPGECVWEMAYLESLYPSDGRGRRLFTPEESVDFELTYTTYYCSCSEFEEVVLRTMEGSGENYHRGVLSAYVCHDECCRECDCIDIGMSEQSLEATGSDTFYEVILDGAETYARGFITDHIARPDSGCEIFPARISDVSTERAFYDLSEPVDLEVTIEFDAAPSCCEQHTEAAFDMYGDGDLHVFAFGGICPLCYDDSCPPDETRILHIPPFTLDLGEHIVHARETGEELYRFYVVGED